MHGYHRILVLFAVVIPPLLAAGLAGQLLGAERAAIEQQREVAAAWARGLALAAADLGSGAGLDGVRSRLADRLSRVDAPTGVVRIGLLDSAGNAHSVLDRGDGERSACCSASASLEGGGAEQPATIEVVMASPTSSSASWSAIALIVVLIGTSLAAAWFGIGLPRKRLRRIVTKLEHGADEVVLADPAQQLATTSDPLLERLLVAFDLLSHRCAGADAALSDASARAATLSAEAAELESRMRRLQDAALDAILTLDGEGRVLELNPSAVALLAMPADQILGQSLEACLTGEGLSEEARTWLITGSEPQASSAPQANEERRELDLETRAGRRVLAEVTAVGWEGPHGARRTLFMRDISERRRVQLLLERSARRASVASEAKTRFLASMSHEIRTPLNAILNMNELLLESRLDDTQRHYATTAGEAARVLLSIVNSVLDFSKIEHDQVEPATRLIDPEEIARTAVDLLAARAHARGLELTLYCDPAVPSGVMTDPGLVHQILLNLIGNAIRFTEEGAVALRVVVARSEQALNFEVIDTGIGIPREAQAGLFSGFRQADSPGEIKGGGSGLGLAISRRLARMLGGDLTLSSVAGEGSCFTLSLVFADGLPMGNRADAAAALDGWRVSLWLDSPVLADALTEQLGAFGIPVEPADRPTTAMPEGCCGQLRLLSGADADDSASTMLLYRVGDRSVSAIAASSTAAELRLPTSPSVLISALRDAIARDARSATARPKDELMERLASCAATAPPLLLAEDSPANQLVATSILRKAGFRVDVVDNGLQAVAAAKRSDYALVLMDLAMPDMDGIEATSCIRALPGRRGQVPIVAMTANVFDEDRRRCFEAGMDGHLSKPVERRTLFEALLRWIRTPDAEAAPPAPPPESTATDPSGSAGDPNPSPDRGSPADSRREKEASPIDEEVLSDLMQDLSEELMPDIVATFVGEAAGRVDAVVQAAGEGDCQRVAEESHALKGSSATFGARLLRDAAAALEKAGRAGDLHAIRTQVDGLQVEADRALSDLRNRFGP